MTTWVLLGSVILNRLITGKELPTALLPVTAIEVAQPALAGVAWFAITSHGTSLIAYAIGGYLLLMTVVQLGLLPRYLKLRFSPGFWAFTFSYAIAITLALDWITRTNPPGATGYTMAAIAGITVLIAAVAVRTVIAVTQRQLATQPGDCLPRPRTPVPGSSSESQRAGDEHR